MDIGVARTQSVNYTGADRPDRMVGSFVTANTLRLLGAHAAWLSRFGGDPRAVGRTIVLNGRPHVVIGVTAADYTDPFGPPEVWLPVTSAPNANWLTRDNPSLWAVGLLKPGVTRAQAQADLSAIARALAAEFPATNAGVGASVIPLREFLVGNTRPTLLILLGFVALILLIACANIANLQLARSTSRRRELSLRAALGAGRGRLVRQLLTENLVLAAIGGACELPALGPVELDGPVLCFSVAITIGAGLLFGALPARWAARAGLADALQTRTGDGAAQGRGDARTIFVAVQLALCIVLLVAAGLLTRSLARIQQVPLGFEPDRLLTAEFRLPASKYDNDTVIAQFAEDALARIRAVPGVRSAALLGSVPLSGNWGTTSYLPEGQAPPADGVPPITQVNFVTQGFFGTMGMPVLRGRDFTPADRAGSAPVALVGQELARRVWPGRSPIGERLRVLGPPEVVVTVVGVVGNVRQFTVTEPPTRGARRGRANGALARAPHRGGGHGARAGRRVWRRAAHREPALRRPTDRFRHLRRRADRARRRGDGSVLAPRPPRGAGRSGNRAANRVGARLGPRPQPHRIAPAGTPPHTIRRGAGLAGSSSSDPIHPGAHPHDPRGTVLFGRRDGAALER